MDMLLLEGWLPFIIAGLIAFTAVIILAKYSSEKTFYMTTLGLMLLSLLMLGYSLFIVGRWTGMGMGFFSVTIFIGLTAGLVTGIFIKK